MTINQRKEKEDKFLNTLKNNDGNISMACKIVGISRQTINRWRQDDSEFERNVYEISTDGKESLADIAEEALKKKVIDGDTTAIIFSLKTLRRDYYGEFKPTPIKDRSESLITGEKEIAAWNRIMNRYAYKNIDESKILTDKEKETMFSLLDKMEKNDEE